MNLTRSLRLTVLLAPSLLFACSGDGFPTEDELAPSDQQAPVADQTPAQVAAAVVQPGAETVPLPAVRDASIRLSGPNVNFGSQGDLDVNRTLVAFNQAALQAAVGAQDYVVSAQLELTLTKNDLRRRAPVKAVTAHRMLKTWTEAGVTWNCAIDSNPGNRREDCSSANKWSMGVLPPNPFVTTASGGATVSPGQTGAVLFDVTADVRGFLAGSLANHGWMLRSGYVR